VNEIPEMNIYVGNLSYETTDVKIEELFKEYGTIASVSVITDKYTGRSKGFGFVEMEVQAEAEEAVKQLNGSVVDGRNLKVNQARPKNEKSNSKSRRY
jgi:RNA recognition motif-containing protein